METVPKKPGRLPMFLSALVCPGAGQLAQRRWFPGIVFGVTFVALFVMFVVYVFRILYAYYSLAFRFDTYEPGPIPLVGAMVSFLAALVTYVANLIDVYLAHRRAGLDWAGRQRR